jgi:hypothetical protein
MNIKISYIVFSMIMISCGAESARNTSETVKLPIAGTWKLLKGTLIEKGNTTVTDYTKNTSFIKILNDTHFAFLQHDLKKGKDSAVFVAGGGRYTLKDSSYTEHLEYCSDRQWEGNDFKFTVSIKNDTLVIKGVEKVESAGVDRVNIEQYVRVK